MASIRKRDGKWRVQIRRKGFPTESATFTHKAQAEIWARERDVELHGVTHGIIPRRTVRQAVERYTREVCPRHRGARWEKIRLQKILRGLPFAERDLQSISRAEIASWRDSPSELASSSLRREYGLLRAVFAVAARDWGWLKDTPFRGLPPPAEGEPRKRRVSDEEVERIVAELGYVRNSRPETAGQFVACAFLLALETAMRQGELLAATRENVLGSVLHIPRSKNGEARDVPLSRAARDLLARLPEDGHLFPVAAGTADVLFRRARARAGIEDLHFHDSRREAASRLAKKLDAMTLAKVTGHKDLRVLLRVYYAPDMADVADALG